MLRLTLLVLLLANAGYLAWSQGWMASLGWKPETQSESFRLRQQIRPETIQVSKPSPAASTPPTTLMTPPPAEPVNVSTGEAPGRCWQAGNFDERQATVLRAALRDIGIPSEAWEMRSTSVTGRWMVYVGKFPTQEAQDARRAELRERGIDYDRAGGNLEPGLSLGRFSSEEAATRELTNLLRKGVRGARVVQERADGTTYSLRLPHVTAELHPLLEQLQPALHGKLLRLCEG